MANYRNYLELVRLPNVFTAMADPAMGLVFVHRGLPVEKAGVLALLLVASSLLYGAGVVLNDLFDVDVDTKQRPERPLPSGRVSRRAAVWLAGTLLLAGLAVAWLIAALVGHFRPGVVAMALAACIVSYDAVLKRTPLGPLAMGGCRLLNVLFGMSVVEAPFGPSHWLVAGGIGVYIAGVTWFARTEAGRSRRLQLSAAIGVMVAGIALLTAFPRFYEHPAYLPEAGWRILMVALGLLIVRRCVRAVVDPDAHHVQLAVKHGILSLVILDASVALYAGGRIPALLVLLLLPPAAWLGRWIRMT